MKKYVFDIEADELYNKATQIKCLSYKEVGSNTTTTLTTYNEITALFAQPESCFIGHYISCYDVPLIKKLVGDPGDKHLFVDTMALSWHLYPKRDRHSLKSFEKELGKDKLTVDFSGVVDLDTLIKRCESDVELTEALWLKQEKILNGLYGTDQWHDFVHYLYNKMHIGFLSEQNPTNIDTLKATQLQKAINDDLKIATQNLVGVMPDRIILTERKPPSKKWTQQNTLTQAWIKWEETLRSLSLPLTTSSPVNVVKDIEPPKPGSHSQVKDWLYSVGWVPKSFKYANDPKTGRKTRKIPQIKNPATGELCESIVDLAAKNPVVSYLEKYFTLKHRSDFVATLATSDRYQTFGGFTNTLRFKHRAPYCNIPGTDKLLGKEIRELIITHPNKKIIGLDLVSLEDTTKRHYIKPLDPAYVSEMEQPGYDSHLDIAKTHGVVTQQDIDDHHNNIVNLDGVRKKFKVVNYAAVYGIQALSLSRDLRITTKEAQSMLDAYWERNWAVPKAMKSIRIKVVDMRRWVLNPVSGFWYELRHEKDIFSTINQSTGVFIFDSFVFKLIENNLIPALQFHDEVLLYVDCNDLHKAEKVLESSIQDVNQEISLNVEIKYDAKIGDNYAEVH